MSEHEGSKLKVFVSYSRSDIAFADQLVAALAAYGITPSIDREGIHGAERWQERLGQLILEADTIVFILTPDSATSDICKWEVDEAIKLHKRIVPIIWQALGETKPHDYLQRLNYIYFYDEPSVTGSGFGTGLVRLINTLTIDVVWIREHTRLGELAVRWEKDGRPVDALLRGMELARMESWREERPANAPELTFLQRDFLQASEEAEAQRANAERRQLEEMRAAQEEREKALRVIDAEQKARAKAQRRNRYFAGAAALFAVSLFSGAIWQSRETQRREALVMTSAAERAAKAGLNERAMRIAVQGLPKIGALPVYSIGWDAPEISGLEAKLAGSARASAIRVVLQGHSQAVVDASFSPDGMRVATASLDNTAKLWDAVSGQLIFTLEGHSDQVRSVAFSPDGARIVTTSSDDTVRVWNAKTGRQMLSFEVQGGLRGGASMQILSGGWAFGDFTYSAMFSPNGKHILTALLNKEAQVWDAQTGQLQLSLKGGDVAAFSPDGGYILSVDGSSLTLWNAESGKSVHTIKADEQLLSAAFSPDGRFVITTSLTNKLQVWDIKGEKALATDQEHEGRFVWAVFSPDGRAIAIALEDGRALLFGANRQTSYFKGHLAKITKIAFSPSGGQVVTASDDRTARIWSTGVWVRDSFYGDAVGASYSQDGMRIVAVYEDGATKVWDTDARKLLFVLSEDGYSNLTASFSRDGTRILTTSKDGKVRVWDTSSRRAILTLENEDRLFGNPGNKHEGRLGGEVERSIAEFESAMAVFRRTTAALSPDGTRIATLSEEAVVIRNAESGEVLLTLEGRAQNQSGRIESMVFSPDGRHIATASLDDDTVGVWDASSGKLVRTLYRNSFTRKTRNRVIRGSRINAVAFSPDGARIAAASLDTKAQVWDVRTGKHQLNLEGHEGQVIGVAFSSEGSRIVTTSSDGDAIFWDAKSGQKLLSLEGLGQLSSQSFSPDGAYIATPHGVLDTKWLIKVRRDELVWRACSERLIPGTKVFTSVDAADPIIFGLEGTDPCERHGPLSTRYWTRLIGVE